MQVFLHLSKSLCDCDIIVEDAVGMRNFFVNLKETEENGVELLEADVIGDRFELTVIPKMKDYKAAFDNMHVSDWKDRLAKNVGNTLFSLAENMLLRVGCKYRISGLKDQDTVFLRDREYVFGTFDRFDFFDLIPMAYLFFEASCNGRRCEISDAFEINRKEVVSLSRKITLMDFGMHLIFTYPIQVGRIKKLTSNKKIRKTLKKFNQMSEDEREKVIAKQEKFMTL